METVQAEVDEVDRPDAGAGGDGRGPSGFGLLLALTAVVAAIRLWLALRATALTALPDEVGFLGSTWLFGRGDPAPPMGWAPFYPAAYPALMTPFSVVTDDPATLATAACVLNVALLAALAPLCWALLGRLGRLRPGVRAVAAVAATASPGLWVAAQRAWPDALLALVWVAALLALWALARHGALGRRIWFGPAVGLLYAAHSRFLPVAALAVGLLVLRLLAPGRDAAGREAARTADAVNLVGMAVVVAVGMLLDGVVESRWEWIADGALERAADAPGDTVVDVPGSLVGQGWYALVATFGLAGIGAVTLLSVAWRARLRDRALWAEPLPLVAWVAVAGVLGVQVATAVQVGGGQGFFETSTLDLFANGRYQEVVLVPLVLAGIARLARRVQGPIGLEAGVAAVAVALAVVVAVALGARPPVIDGAAAPGTAWLRDVWPDRPVVAPTLLMLVVLAGFVLLRPSPTAGDAVDAAGTGRGARSRELRAAAAAILALVALAVPGVERADDLVAAGRVRQVRAERLDPVREALDGRPVAYAVDVATVDWVVEVGWALAPEGVVTYEPRRDDPPEPLVIAPAGDGEPGARRPAIGGLDGAAEVVALALDDRRDRPLVLWEVAAR